MNKIRWRIAAPYILLILAFMLGLGIYLSNFFQQSYIAQLERQLTLEAQIIGESTLPNWSDPQALKPVVAHWADLLNARVTLIDPQGNVLGESEEDPTLLDNHLTRPEVINALAASTGTSIRFSHTVGYDMLYTAIRLGEPTAPTGIVRVAVPLTEVYQNIAEVQRVLVVVSLIVTLIAILIAILIAQTTSKPLEELTLAANSMAMGNLVQKPLSTSITEIGQLVKAFNSMAVQIRQQVFNLETERGKLAAVLSNMNDGVMIIDAEGRIQLVNPAAAALLGITIDVVGRSLVEVVRPFQPFELWKQCSSEQTPQHGAFDFNRANLMVHAIPLKRSLPGHSLLLVQDVTQQYKVDSMRRDFISNVSHELRTPLAALKIIVETLQDGALEDKPAAHKFLANMEGEIDSLSLMVMELLELSRIESGRVPLEPQQVSPLDLLEPAADRLKLQAERAGLTLTVDCPPNLPTVLADPSRLQQVLTNLIHNAIKFTPVGGTVQCGAELINEKVTFYVRDSGIGLSADDLPRVFERFYKADRARSGGGTGLGLSICRHIVEMHNGRIWITSKPDQGSTFSFTLG